MTMSTPRAAEFDAELSRLRLKRKAAEPERRLILLGTIIAACGLTLLAVALFGTRGAATLQQQVDYLALGPLGLGLTLVGAAIWIRYSLTRYLRYWLIRTIFEDRDNTDRIVNTLAADEHDA